MNNPFGQSPRLSAAQVAALITAQVPDPLTQAKGGTGATTAIGAFDNLHGIGTNIASASSVDIWAATGSTVTLTGTTDITALGTTTAGRRRKLYVASYLSLKHNDTSLICPGKRDLFLVAGDVVVIQSLGSGNNKVVQYTPIHPFATKHVLNLAHCTATNVNTVNGNSYQNSSAWLIYINSGVVGYGRVTPHTATGAAQVGLLPGGSAGPNYVDWTKPFMMTVRVNARVSTKAGGSAGGFCMFLGVNPATMALGAEGILAVMRGTDATTGVNYTVYGHDGSTLNTGSTTTGTLANTALIELGLRWVPQVGAFFFRDGTCVAKVTGSNLPAGDGPADSNICGLGIENVSGNTVKAEMYFNTVTIHT